MSINATLIVQMIVFAILVWFTMSFVWPPIATALDERAKKIAEGLSAADKAKSDLEAAQRGERGRQSEGKAGTGLGLAIAQQLTQAMGGRLTLSNRQGGGLCAEIELR